MARHGADIRLMPCRFTGARWITADTLAYMMTSACDLRLTAERHPQVHFHPRLAHAGLSLSAQGARRAGEASLTSATRALSRRPGGGASPAPMVRVKAVTGNSLVPLKALKVTS